MDPSTPQPPDHTTEADAPHETVLPYADQVTPSATSRREDSCGETALFWALYFFSGMACMSRVTVSGGIHHSLFGHAPGETTMTRYALAAGAFTVALMAVYTWKLRFFRFSWAIGAICGLGPALLGMLLSVLRMPR